MVICAAMAFTDGDITRLMYFVDYNGNRCGEGDLSDYKYTHWTHWTNSATNVCVSSCPGANIKFTLTTGADTVGSTDIGYARATTADAGTGCTGTYTNCADSATLPAALISGGKAECCTVGAAPAPDGLYICVPSAVQSGSSNYAKEYVETASALIVAATSDLIVGWWIILTSALVALVVSYIWVAILKQSAGCFVWSIVAASNIAALLATAMMFYLYNDYSTKFDESSLSSDEQMMYVCLVALIIIGLITFILFCMTVCYCEQISIAVGIISAACDAINDVPASIYFPLIQYSIMLAFVVYWVIVAAYMMSTGEYVQTSGVYSMEWNETMQQAAIYHLFGLLWTLAFMRHMTILILAGSFGTWYWTEIKDKKDGKFDELHPSPVYHSFQRSMAYHTGTVAFGSFIIALIQMAKIVLEYLKEKQDSEWLKYVITCVQCLLDCFERLMEYVSRMAYIVTACKGNMFCTAAMESFGFLFRHMAQHVIVGYITEFLMILGKGFILAGTVAICFLLCGLNSDISSPYILLVVCALIAYFVACLFLGVVDTAIDTIMVCFCWEKDANGAMENQAGEKAFYGTEELIQFVEGAKTAAAKHLAGATVKPEETANPPAAAAEPAAQ